MSYKVNGLATVVYQEPVGLFLVYFTIPGTVVGSPWTAIFSLLLVITLENSYSGLDFYAYLTGSSMVDTRPPSRQVINRNIGDNKSRGARR